MGYQKDISELVEQFLLFHLGLYILEACSIGCKFDPVLTVLIIRIWYTEKNMPYGQNFLIG